jgi:copper oxidase (laccase) domain-containing protein|tara:strand:- start:422 stop:1111 length:690 start_codon:yes stop_codon:yes gene_type:complete
LANRQRFLYAHHVQEASFFLAPLLVSPRRRAAFVERISDIATSHDKAKTLALLQPRHNQAALDLGFQETYFAEQVHGAGIAVITKSSPQMTPGVDGLVTREDLLLGIHVADCGALYLLDQETQAFGLLHSGKKGTELNITGKAIAAMAENFGTSPSNLIAILSPCIRPPHYEIDFPSTIREQALDAGITSENYHDCGLCTASDLDRFYSYRLEKGNTGRLLALLGRTSS